VDTYLLPFTEKHVVADFIHKLPLLVGVGGVLEDSLQRLKRGEKDLPLGGGIDVLIAVHTKIEDGRLIGMAEETYILLAEFTDKGVQSWGRHQYGNLKRENSPHYADQAEAFTKPGGLLIIIRV